MNKKHIRLTEGDLHRIIKESVKRILREQYEMPHFYRIDMIDQYDENNGYSVCIKSKDDLGEDNVVDYAIKRGIIDKWDVKEYAINVEDITNDEYELRFWEKDAVSVD